MYKKIQNGLIIILLFLLTACSNNEVNKEHIVYNREATPFIVIKGSSYYIYDFEDKLEKTTTFYLTLNIVSGQDKDINYELKAVNAIGEVLKYQSNKTIALPYQTSLINNTNVGGNGFKEFLLKIDNLNFYEEVLPITNQEIKDEGYPNKFINEKIDLEFVVTEDLEKYNITFKFDSEKDIHIDFQSFIVSIDARVYSFLGLYGYVTDGYPYYIEDNYIYKDMDIKHIYLRMNHYNIDGVKIETRAKLDLDTLIK